MLFAATKKILSMHKDNRQQLRKQSLLGEPYGSEPNLYDAEKPRRQTVSDSSSVFNNENMTEEFLYDAELLNAWFWSKLVEEMYDDDDDEVTGT